MGRRSEVTVPISGNLRANNGDALLAAAIAGQGIVQQPTFIVADALRAGELVQLTLDHPSEQLTAHALYLPHRHPPAKVRVFIDFLVSHFTPEPPWDRGILWGASYDGQRYRHLLLYRRSAPLHVNSAQTYEAAALAGLGLIQAPKTTILQLAS
jgi:DNA-binding transcriptional LysR family regulator